MSKRWIFKALGLIMVMAIGMTSLASYWYLNYRLPWDMFNSDGTNIFYTIDGEGEPVILVHGFAANGFMNWRSPGVVAELEKEGFQVISMDMRGHGWSEKPEEVGQYGEQMMNDVVRLMDHLEIDRSHVVGYSLGGIVTQNLAVHHPDRFISATTIASGWERADTSLVITERKWIAQTYREGKPVFILSFVSKTEKEYSIVREALMYAMVNVFNSPTSLAATLEGAEGLIVSEEELQNIDIPFLVMVGDEDILYPMAQNLTHHLQNEEYAEVKGGDHFNTASKKETHRYLSRFLKKNSETK